MNQIVDEIRQILRQARNKAYAAVNFAMAEAYWHIGKRIVQEELNGEIRAGYGKQLIKELSKQLAAEFGKGFSEANLKNFRQFYLTFPCSPKQVVVNNIYCIFAKTVLKIN